MKTQASLKECINGDILVQVELLAHKTLITKDVYRRTSQHIDKHVKVHFI